jgi:hypothetical protein
MALFLEPEEPDLAPQQLAAVGQGEAVVEGHKLVAAAALGLGDFRYGWP